MDSFQSIVLIALFSTAFSCTELDVQPVEGSCSSYSVCRNGSLIIEKCSFGNHFNPDTKSCEIFFNVNCTESAECEDGLLYKHETPFAFYTCLNGRLRLEFCPLGQQFNGEHCVESDKPDSTILLSLKKKPTCREGDKKPDGDCEKFLECTKGDWSKKSCPHNQAFDINRKLCKFIWEAVCSETSCIEGYKYSVPNSNVEYTECINHQRIKKKCGWLHVYDNNKHECVFKLVNSDLVQFKQVCQNGGKQADTLTSYLYCNSGHWERYECPKGQIFDSKILECADCVDGISSSSCDSFEVCESGVLKKYECPFGSSFDGVKCAFDHKCITNRQKREVTKEQKCINGGRQPSESENLNEYQVCENGNWVVAKCGTNEVFDVNVLSCKVEGICEKGAKMIKHGFCKTYLQCKNNKWVDGTCPNKHIFDGAQCIENNICNRYSSIKNDCAKYKDNKDLKVYTCPPGFRFDKVLRECTYFAQARCDSDGPRCYGNEKIGDPKDCSKYSECVNGHYVSKSCSSWKSGWFYKFDFIKQKCVSRFCADCTPSVETNNLLLESEVCEEGNTEPVEGTCRLYRVCKNGAWVNAKCSPCKRYDTNTNGCVRVWSEPCEESQTDPTENPFSTEDPTGPTQTVTIKPSTKAPTPKPRHCKEGDRRGEVGNCKKYQECVNGDWEEKSCWLFGKFDTATNQCLYATVWKAKCA